MSSRSSGRLDCRVEISDGGGKVSSFTGVDDGLTGLEEGNVTGMRR
jgi:hypothetical protein